MYAKEVGPESQKDVKRQLSQESMGQVMANMQSHGIYKKDEESHTERADLIAKLMSEAGLARGLLADDAAQITGRSVRRTVRYNGASRTWKGQRPEEVDEDM